MRPVPRVVVLGGGFGGLQCARALRGRPVEVVLIDRADYHLFTPLLYQVASCLLNPAEITAPLRKVFRGAPNVRFRQGEVTGVDFDAQRVQLRDSSEVPYDYLVIATGSVTNYYGNESVAQHALGLKDLEQALQLRNHVLQCLELATQTDDDDVRCRLLTFCIVGGGPTGVEYAGALAELVRLILPNEYPELPRHAVRIVLLEGGDRLLPQFAPKHSRYAQKELERRGVEVRTNTLVAAADEKSVVLRDGAHIATESLVWTAGVRPNDVLDENPRRIEVDEHLRVVGKRNAYAIGDVADGRDTHGDPLPMLSPVAMQAGRYVAHEIADGPARRPFRYRDKGVLATIGRTDAVGQVKGITFQGFVGWVVWLVVHLYYLIGFENRLQVMARWAWYYVRLDRPVRIILRAGPPKRA